MNSKYESLGQVEGLLHLDEPYFVLRGQDLLTPYAIMGYAALLRATAAGMTRSSHRSFGRVDTSALTLRAQAKEVEEFAAATLAWQAANPDKTKLPD